MKIKICFLLIISLQLLCATPSRSQELTDTMNLSSREFNIQNITESSSTNFSVKQLIVPGAFMVAGVIGAIDSENNLNKSVRDAMQDLSDDHSFKLDEYLRFLPSVSHLILGSVGIKSKHNFKERFLISATSHVAMLAMGYGLKFVLKEQRPDLSDNHSFPSGHVALAFTGAELLRSEYGTAYGIAGYAVATSVAFLRLYNNKHWLHDVIMGAGIGILSARIGNWLLPFERKLFKINKKSSSTSTVATIPYYNVNDKAFMLSMVAVF